MLDIVLSIHSFLANSGQEWADNYLPLSMLAVVVAVLVHTIMLMGARAFHVKELENYAMSEILQAAATAFMVVFFITMLVSAMQIAGNLIHGELTCAGKTMTIANPSGGDLMTLVKQGAMNDAYEVIKCRLQQRATEVSNAQGQVVKDAVADYALLNLQASVFGVTIFKGDWLTSVYQKTENNRITNNLATVLLIGLNAQYALAEYLRINMLNIFLPVGLLLRSFYFTRSPGALLMALGIGMYFVFPVVYILLDPGFVATPIPEVQPAPQPTKYCYATMSSAASLISTAQSQGLGSTASLDFTDLKSTLRKSYISLMLHPLVALFLTLVVVRYIMTVLGADTYELTKMVTKVI